MIRVGQLSVKSFVSPEANLREAAKVISASPASGAVAVNEKGKLEFLITEEDVVRAIAKGEDPEAVKAEEWATPSPVTVRTDTEATDALRIMKAYRVAHLPVVDEKVLGLVYVRDLLYAIMDHIPIGKATLEGLTRPLPEVKGTVAEAAREMVLNETEAVSVNGKLLSAKDVVKAVAEDDPYAAPVEKYAKTKVIVADERTDVLCALQLMKNNGVDYLVIPKGRLVTVEDLGYKVPEIVREFVRYIMLVKGKVNHPNAIKTIGPYDAVVIVEGEEELAKVADSVEGEVLVLVERP